MRIGPIAVLAALLFSALSVVPATASEGVDLSLQIPGEALLFGENGIPVLVAGVWHRVSVTLASQPQNSLALWAHLVGYQKQDMSSYYRWERDETNDTWFDPLYDAFIRPELSSSGGTEVLFHIGIDAAAIPGTWRLEIIQDGLPIAEWLLEVRSPQISYGLSSADFNFRAEPWTAATLSSEDQGQYLRVINQGNIPLRLHVSFDKLQNRLSLVNPSDVAHVNDDTRYFLRLTLDPRPPQIIKVKGVSRVEVDHVVPSPGASQLLPAIEGEFNLNVVVGRTGYSVQALGNLIFQTLETLRADYGSLVTWQVYLTGDQEVSFQVEVNEARLVGVLQGESRLVLPAVLTTFPDAELPLTMQVRTDVPSTVAEVTFTIRILETGEVKVFRTTITVGPKPIDTPIIRSYLWLFASIASVSVLALVSYNHWKFVNLTVGKRGGVRASATRGAGKKEQTKREEKRKGRTGSRKKGAARGEDQKQGEKGEKRKSKERDNGL